MCYRRTHTTSRTMASISFRGMRDTMSHRGVNAASHLTFHTTCCTTFSKFFFMSYIMFHSTPQGLVHTTSRTTLRIPLHATSSMTSSTTFCMTGCRTILIGASRRMVCERNCGALISTYRCSSRSFLFSTFLGANSGYCYCRCRTMALPFLLPYLLFCPLACGLRVTLL